MRVLQEIALPQSESFYTQTLGFDVVLDASACGSFSLADGTNFSLDGPTLLASVLASANGTRHLANLESISFGGSTFSSRWHGKTVRSRRILLPHLLDPLLLGARI